MTKSEKFSNPARPNSVNKHFIINFDHWLVKNFEKLCVNRIIGSNKLVHAEQPQKILCNKNFSFFFSCQYKKLSIHQKKHFFSCFQFDILCFFFQQSHVSGGLEGFFQTSSHQPVFYNSFLLDWVRSN